MGDLPPTTVTPPATGRTEVPVETNPVQLPNPIGTQAPTRETEPKGSEHRPQSRREAIQAAFERASQPQRPQAKAASRAAPGPAEATPGHNKPPPAEASDDDGPIDLRKRPSEQPRGDKGRFAPREPARAQPQGQPQAQPQARGTGAPQQQASRSYPPLPATAPYSQPVTRMSERAKADWAGAPESVRADVHRMYKEFKTASDYYKADHAAMNDIRQFHELATSQGTTLKQALSNYVSMEQKLRSDPIAGLDVIVNNLRLKTSDGQPIGLRDIAYYVLSQTPDQLRQVQQGNMQQAASQQIGALHQQIAQLQSTVEQMHTQQQHGTMRSAVDQYAAQRPRFDELGDLIEQEVKLGFDLDTAYRRAELLRPATQAAQTRTTSAQTRPTIDRSISGAPDAGPNTNGAERRPAKQVGRREAISNAMRSVSGRA